MSRHSQKTLELERSSVVYTHTPKTMLNRILNILQRIYTENYSLGANRDYQKLFAYRLSPRRWNAIIFMQVLKKKWMSTLEYFYLSIFLPDTWKAMFL